MSKRKKKPLVIPPPYFIGTRSGHNANCLYARDGENQHEDSAVAMFFGITMNRPVEHCRDDERMPTMEFVRDACNLHAELVTALEKMLATSRQIKGGVVSDAKEAAEEHTRAILAKVKQKTETK